MNKDEAIEYMIQKVEEIERERLSANMSIDASKQKKEVVDSIIKQVKGLSFENEDKQD